jgi:hypothetical protein
MGRPVSLRSSYVNDARYMARICAAVEQDNARPREWRARVIELLQEVTGLFMGAPKLDNPPLPKLGPGAGLRGG